MRIVTTLALILTAAFPGSARATQLPFHLTACTAGKARLPAHCGTLEVYEDRAARAGRRITLHFIEIDAAHPTNRAIFWNPGGPGADDLSAVPFIADGGAARELIGLRDGYNLVFVDNRGTGLSHPIECDLHRAQHPEWYYEQEFPDAALRACRAQRLKDTNLNAYTTDITSDDLDDVRAALQYPKIVLDGSSYGTMFFLDYARRHPSHVESLVLSGVAPPGLYCIPLPDAQGAQRAMTDLVRDCLHDHLCHRTFPRFPEHFAALLHRFDDRGALSIQVLNAATKRSQTVWLSKEVFADSLRHVLYTNEGAAYVPYVVEQAYGHDYRPLSRLIDVVTAFFGGLIGLNLSVTCAEDIPFITEAQIVRTSVGSFQGDTRVRAQQHACLIWNVRRASALFAQPVRSSAPILMISGAEDPATPPEYGRAALSYLPNARQIVIPHATHDSESVCTDALIVTFVHTRDARHLDASKCIASSRRPPFATSMKGLGSQ